MAASTALHGARNTPELPETIHSSIAHSPTKPALRSMSELRERPSAVKGDAASPSKGNGKADPRSDTKKELDAKIEKLRNTEFIRKILVYLGIIALVFFARKQYYRLTAPSTPSSTTFSLPDASRFPLPSLPPSGTFHPHLDPDVPKRNAVKRAYKHSWDAYVRDAWGWDEYHPLSKSGSNLTDQGGVGYQIVDCLDGLLILGMEEEFVHAAEWVRDELEWDKDAEFNTFETTIRLLGGLLSAYHMSSTHPDYRIEAFAPMFIEKAVDLADRLMPAFNTPSGIPLSNINLAKRQGVPDMGNQGIASLAEAASIQLELKYLSEITGDYTYWRKAERVTELVKGQTMLDGICPIFINPQNGQFVMSEIRLGSRGDSYYEYLLKQWLQTEPVYRDMYDEAMGGIKKHLIGRTALSGVMYTQELHPARHPDSNQHSWQVVPKQDHLVCFLGGSLILGVTEGGKRGITPANLDKSDQEDLAVGEGIIEGCMKTYETETGLGPEIAMFVQSADPNRASKLDWYIKEGENLIDARNILRPETVESLLLAYRATGDEKYREYGWKIFEAFEEHCRVDDGGYVGVTDVQQNPPRLEDKMETFWMGETLKYLYLLFDDSNHLKLDEIVFNTEAHILPVFTPKQLTAFSTS